MSIWGCGGSRACIRADAAATLDALFFPSCSLIFTRSDPPTMPTVTCCAGSRTVVSAHLSIAWSSKRHASAAELWHAHLSQLLEEVERSLICGLRSTIS